MAYQRRPVEVIALPITISTVTIDGKRISPSVFKQIAVESLIDEESGELRGIPIGWINVHQKDCPEHHHLHILWVHEHALRLATVAGPSKSERYLEKKRQSLSLRRQLTDLLAYMLGLEFRYQGSVYTNDEQRTLKIEGYTLPVSMRIAHLLDALEEARDRVDQEQALWQSHPSVEADVVQALASAQLLVEQLARQKVRLAHPTLYNHRDKRLANYERTGDDEEGQTYGYYDMESEGARSRLVRFQTPSSPPTRPKKGKWFVYEASSEDENRQILWYTPEVPGEEEILAVERQISEQASILPTFLAQQTVERDMQAVRKAIDDVKEPLHDFLASSLSQKKTAKASLTPKAIFALYQQEQDRFDAYTQGWQQVVVDLQESEQLFILS